MDRTNIYLTAEQRAGLDARARAVGMSRAELIRQVLDRELSGGSEPDPLAADLAAIEDSFGALGGGALSLDRGDGARGAHLERIATR
jgi:hypothetical protein